jgi:hypothetical protein
VAEIHQAQQVKRLRAAQQANLMAARIQYARAMTLLKRGLANATAAERAELAGTLIAMQRAENEALTQIGDQMRIITGAESGVALLDDDLSEVYHGLTHQLDRLIAPVADDHYVNVTPPRAPRATAATTAATAATVGLSNAPRQPTPSQGTAAPAAPAAPAVASGSPRQAAAAPPATGHSGPQRALAAATAGDAAATAAHARQHLTGVWNRADVERVCSVGRSKAGDLIRDWRAEGLIVDVTNPAHHYGWADSSGGVG